MKIVKKYILLSSLIVVLLLFLRINSFAQTKFIYLNPIDTTYTLDFWETHKITKAYDEWELLIQEITSFYEREQFIENEKRELELKTGYIVLLENTIELNKRNIEIKNRLLEECNQTLEESEKLNTSLKKEVKRLSRIKSALEVTTGIGLTAVAYFIISLIV